MLDTMTPPEYSRVESVRLQDTIVGPGALFRAEALRRAGPLRTDLRYLADKELWLRLSRVGRFIRVAEPLACWRRHGGALTVAERGREMAEERLRILDALFADEPGCGAPGGAGPGLQERVRARRDGGRARLQRRRRAVLRRRPPRARRSRRRPGARARRPGWRAHSEQLAGPASAGSQELEREVQGLRKGLLEGRPALPPRLRAALAGSCGRSPAASGDPDRGAAEMRVLVLGATGTLGHRLCLDMGASASSAGGRFGRRSRSRSQSSWPRRA